MNADRVISGLLQRGVPEHIALGIAGNLAVESGFDPGINEIAPLVPGSRGGFGLSQWTGPRRRQYEGYAQSVGAPLDDIDAQLDFLMWELENTEKKAGQKLFSAQTPEQAARVFSESFLRPGIPHLDRRLEETRRLAGGTYSPAQPTNTLAAAEPPETPNALSQPPLRLRANLLDPSAFMNQTTLNRLAYT